MIPVIDLAHNEADVAALLVEAYNSVGFALVTNHGIDQAVIEAAFDASRRFHALSPHAKSAISVDRNHRGFIALDTAIDQGSDLAQVTTPNHSESFMALGPIAHSTYLAGPNQWPDLDGFRRAVEAYHDALEPLARRLANAIFAGLGHSTPDGFDTPTTWLRLLRYPPTPAPAAGAQRIYGSAPHRDFGAITLLAQDGTEGLEVMQPGGDWIGVTPQPGSLVLNTGDLMTRWSGGKLRSTPHRVINRTSTDRYSIAFFFDPDLSTTVRSLDAPGERAVSFEQLVRAELTTTYKHHEDH